MPERMKKFMITGGLVGFLIGIISGWMQQCEWPSVLWRASAAALAAGVLVRWWGRLWIESVRQVEQQRRAAEEAQELPATPLSVKP